MPLRFLLSRLAQAVPTVAGLLVLNFCIIHLAPGDPVVALGGEHGDAAYYAFLRARFALDRPLPEQLVAYGGNALRGDLGTSFVHGRPVIGVILERLPATVLLVATALTLRLVRSGLGPALGADYVRAARAKGLSEARVIHHALRNVMLPVVTVIGGRTGLILSGAVLVEVVFAWPGLGRLVLSSLLARDYPVLLGLFLLVSLGVVLANLLTRPRLCLARPPHPIPLGGARSAAAPAASGWRSHWGSSWWRSSRAGSRRGIPSPRWAPR